MFDHSRTRFHDKISKKAAQLFHCTVSKVFDRVKSVALWSANIRQHILKRLQRVVKMSLSKGQLSNFSCTYV